MPTVHVYHTSNFLDYRGDHRQLIPPTRPVATLALPPDHSPAAALETAFGRTQHLDRPWYYAPQVTPRLRSTSVGDVLELVPDDAPAGAAGDLFVVERAGFRPFQPRAIHPAHRLAEAQRALTVALEEPAGLAAAARTALSAIEVSLAASGYPESDSQVLWEKAQVGDLVGNPEAVPYRVIARRLRPKWRARHIAALIPNAVVFIDGARSWAVLAPVDSHVE